MNQTTNTKSTKNNKNAHSNQSDAIAIVGMGCRFPKASGLDQYWANIKSGLDAICDIPDTHWKPEDYFDADKSAPDMTYAKTGGFIDPIDFDPLEFGITPNNLEATDTTHLLGLVAARDALRDAGYATSDDLKDGRAFDRDRCSAIIGVTGTLELVIPLGARLGHPHWKKALKDAGVDPDTAADVVERISNSYVPWQENSFPGLLGNVAAGRIANRFNLGGTNCVVDAACASSLSALHLAMLELSSGRSDMAITGGIDSFNDIFMYMCFSKTPALSPTGHSRPFSANGDGTILGEGVGVLVLKRLEDAQNDNDKIYAVIRGMGSSSDGLGNAVYAPSAKGQAKALRNAYKNANVSPADVEMLEAHGTGTVVGDRIELEALTEVYREADADNCWCSVGSVKSMIGHTKAAAGVANIIKTALALHNKVLPPTIKIDKPLDIIKPGTAPHYANTVKRPWVSPTDHKRFAALSSFGFGGSNFHCVLEEADPIKTHIDWDESCQLLAWSAADSDSLIKSIQTWQADSTHLRIRAQNARTAFSSSDNCRLIIVNEDPTKCDADIQQAIERLSTDHNTSWSLPSGVYYGYGEKNGSCAAIFPGQGSQRTGMLRDLSCQFPEMIAALDGANTAFNNNIPQQRLSDIIYPIPVFDKDLEKEQTTHLRQTNHAQPALGAVSIGAWNTLKRFQLSCSHFAGHSFGEVTALCAAEYISEENMHRIACTRGSLMSSASSAADDSDCGSMLAVSAELAVIEKHIDEQGFDLIIANRNAPQQAVLSGSTDAINAARLFFKAQKIRCAKLPVAAAFHSRFVADAENPFHDSLKKISFKASDHKCYANITGKAYPKSSAKMKSLLSQQLVNPVKFVEQIQKMYADGVRYFIECGPSNVLSNLVNSILADSDIHCISIDASKGNKNGIADLAKTLALTASLGFEIDLSAWDNEFSIIKTKPAKMSVSISGANHRTTFKEIPPRAPSSAPSPVAIASASATASTPATTTANNASLPTELLQAHQNSIMVLQQMQEQTALLHQQYLSNQETSQQFINQLMQQNQALMSGGAMPLPAPIAAVTPTPAINAAAVPTVTPVQIAAPVPVQAAPTPALATPANNNADLQKNLIEVVSEKTGYPTEMLTSDMNLDADLGIDSIKRVEILSALQERMPNLPAVQAEDMGSIQTLQDIVNYCGQGNDAPAADTTTLASTNNSNNVQTDLMAVVSEKTGYPIEMLTPEMQLDSDLGIDSIKRVEILSALQEANPALPEISAEDLGSIHSLQDIIDACSSVSGTATATTSPAAPTPTNSPSIEQHTQVLLSVVAEKTGYPTEMIELDMNLDADLGIDSIKRVEILSAVQEQLPNAPIVRAEDLGSLETLRQIIDYLSENSAPASTAPATAPAKTNNIDIDALSETLLSIVAEKTGYPPEMLDVQMQLDSDLGIDSIKRVEILSALQEHLPDAPVVQAEDIGNLHTLADIIEHLQASTGSSEPAQILHQQTDNAQQACIIRQPLTLSSLGSCEAMQALTDKNTCVIIDDGSELCQKLQTALNTLGCNSQIIKLGDLITTDSLDLLIVCASHVQSQEHILQGFLSLQSALPTLEKNTGRCIAITQLGGQYAIEGQVPLNVLSAAWLGMIKTAAREYTQVACKTIDLEIDYHLDALLSELQNMDQHEVALHAGKRWQPQLLDKQSIEQTHQNIFDAKDTVIISGGARGVTAEVAVALAKNFQLRLALLGRSELVEDEADYLTDASDEAAIKKALLANWSDGTPTPKDIASACSRILANREMQHNIKRMRTHGSEVSYYSLDICDAAALNSACEKIRTEYGSITGIIHGAGVLADKLISEKTTEQFARVLATKVDGAYNLLHATQNDTLKAIVFFSSSTARFGRTGQIDYAAANEILNKLAQRERHNRMKTKVLSINWGPWDGGMVTPALKELFASEGVDVIDLQLGAQYLCDELCHESSATEIVILGGNEINSGFPIDLSDHSDHKKSSDMHTVYERELSVATHNFLRSHVINGKAVLPMALIIEWLTHAAMHDNPGLVFFGFEDLRVFKGIILDEKETLTLSFKACDAQWNNGQAVIEIELLNGETLHARTRIHLTDSLGSDTPSAQAQPHGTPAAGNPYEDQRLFHGTDLQGLQSIETCDESGIVAWSRIAPDADHWIENPLRKKWYADPLALDVAFQCMIVWSHQQRGCASLPTRAGSYQQFQNDFSNNGQANACKIIARIISSTAHSARANIEFIDMHGNLIARILDYECVIDASLDATFQRNKLSTSAQS